MLTTFLHLRSHDTGDRSIYRGRASDITLRQVERSAVPCDRGLLLLCGDGRRARRRRRGRAPAARQSVQSNVSPLDGSAVSSVSFDASSLPRSGARPRANVLQCSATVPWPARPAYHVYRCIYTLVGAASRAPVPAPRPPCKHAACGQHTADPNEAVRQILINHLATAKVPARRANAPLSQQENRQHSRRLHLFTSTFVQTDKNYLTSTGSKLLDRN